MSKSNAQAQREWYYRMTPEQKREHNQARYSKYKDNYNKNSLKWAQRNPHKSHASVHQTTIRKNYPDQWEQSDITIHQLQDYLYNNRGCECRYCGSGSYHIDHILPLSRGGKHTWDNIQMICEICNLSKRNRTHEEYLEWIEKIIYRNYGTFSV